MAHRLVINDKPLAPDEISSVSTHVRFHALDEDCLAVICARVATRDGVAITGNLAVVERGEGALIRCGGLRLEVVWEAQCERLVVPAQRRCRLCFGGFAADESGVRCVCNSWFHDLCDRVRRDCPACGAAGGTRG
jgi:hypothetical protein